MVLYILASPGGGGTALSVLPSSHIVDQLADHSPLCCLNFQYIFMLAGILYPIACSVTVRQFPWRQEKVSGVERKLCISSLPKLCLCTFLNFSFRCTEDGETYYRLSEAKICTFYAEFLLRPSGRVGICHSFIGIIYIFLNLINNS